MKNKTVLDKDMVKRLYVDEMKSTREISSEMGVSRHIVERTINQMGLMRDKTQIMNIMKVGAALTEEHKSKISKAMTGKPKTNETKEKISEALIGRKRPVGVIQKIVNTKMAKHVK